MASRNDGQQHVILKMGAFRDFASSLAGQLVEQVCQEFEREVSVMYNDLVIYRGELERLAELLGAQLNREKDLHMRLGQMGELHSASVAQIEQLARQQPDTGMLHDLVEQMHSGHLSVTSAHLNGANQSQMAASNHVQQAQELQKPLYSAETEYNRIVQLLSQPLIPGASPAPTGAAAGVQISGGGPRLKGCASGPQYQPLPGQPMTQSPPVSPALPAVRGPQAVAPPKVVMQGPPMVVQTAGLPQTQMVVPQGQMPPGQMPPQMTYPGMPCPAPNGFFDRMDLNHDGKLSRGEFARAMG